MSLLSYFISFLINPFFWVVGLLVLSLILKKKRKRSLCIGFGIGIMLLFSNPLLHRIVTRVYEPAPVPITNLTVSAPYDYGIVLGGFTRMHAWPMDRLHLNESANRFSNALELYHRKKVKKLAFVSGANTSGSSPVNEARLARETAIRFGVREEDIIALQTSRNTYENAVEMASFLNENPESSNLLLITSASHMPRALACFQKQGFDPDIFPTDHRSNHAPSSKDTIGSLLFPNPATFTAWQTLFREWLAVTTYRLRRKI